MYKVLIADDELLVRVGLKTTIDWEGNGFYVVGEARNGKEAIEMFSKEISDILITDVSMPNMNGLELIRILQQKNQNLKSIILTHYEDFNYAQEAVNLGVIAYLLKSNLTQENLLKYLIKATDELEPLISQHTLPVLNYKMELLIQPDLLNSEQLEEIKNIYFPYDVFVISTMRFLLQNSNPEFPAVDISNFDKVVENISRQVFSEHDMKVFPLILKDKAIFIFNIPNNAWNNDYLKKLEKIMSLLKNNIKKYLNLNMSIGISSNTYKVEELYQAYYDSLKACENSFFEKNNIAIYKAESKEYSDQLDEINLQELNSLIKQKNISELKTFIEDFFDTLIQYKNSDYLLQNFRILMTNLEEISANKNSARISYLNQINSSEDIINQFYNISALKQYISDLYQELTFSLDSDNKDIQYSYIVQKSMDYIHKHFVENISLLSVAQHAGVSRSYLSFLFKQELNLNFSTYITKTRIEKAKHLLSKTNMKIYEIAEEIGFDSPYYFSKVFKEKTGMTCKYFRNSNYLIRKEHNLHD